MEYSNLFVCVMGVGTVFFGLVCLIGITMLMSAVCGSAKRSAPLPGAVSAPAAAVSAPAAAVSAGENREAIAAAVAAAIAEELGTDITGIRIVSMKKL